MNDISSMKHDDDKPHEWKDQTYLFETGQISKKTSPVFLSSPRSVTSANVR